MSLLGASITTLTVDTMTDILQVGSGNRAIVIGLVVSNNDASDPATIELVKTNTSNTVQSHVISQGYSIPVNDGLHINTKIVLAATEKLRIESNKANVSVEVAYDEGAV